MIIKLYGNPLPNEVIQMAIDAHQLQLAGQSGLTIDEKYLDVQRLEYQIGEAVAALIIKEYIGQKKKST